jgi:hypothetical protein
MMLRTLRADKMLWNNNFPVHFSHFTTLCTRRPIHMHKMMHFQTSISSGIQAHLKPHHWGFKIFKFCIWIGHYPLYVTQDGRFVNFFASSCDIPQLLW